MSKKEVPAASWVGVASLAPWAKNPRVNDEAAEDVARSVIRFGFGAPVIARAENREVIAGHTRLKAVALLRVWWVNESEDAKKTWSADARKIATDTDPQVPVRFLDLSEAEAHALALADNKIEGTWDDEKLAGVLRDLAAEGASLDGLGWDDGVLDTLIGTKPTGEEWGKVMSGLPNEDRQPFQQMTFTVHDDQAGNVRRALDAAKKLGVFEGPNENGNGNALDRVCTMFLAHLEASDG